ncbi:MAG TPA: PAS domain S-box protein, partial [Burkholderiales bacterium]|nr:PAS domain S-box protein [Burkholderiales bacterium]
ELYGYSLEELIGADARMLRAEQASGSFDQVWQDLRNSSAKLYETQHRKKDGTLIDVEVSSRRLQIGDKVFVQAIVRDISARVRAEEAQKRHYALVKLLGDLAACANEARTPEEALRTSVRLICEHGRWSAGHAVTFTADATFSAPVASVWHPEHDAGLAAFRHHRNERSSEPSDVCLLYASIARKQPVWIAKLSEAPASQEVDLLRQAGIESAVAFPVLLQDRVVALLEFFSREARVPDQLFLDNIGNITSHLLRPIERFHATAANAALAAVVASSDDAIISRDMDRRIVSWNAGAERLFGYTAEEAIGRNISMLIPPDMEADAAASRERLKEGLTVKSHDVVRLAKDGRRIDVSLTQSPIRNESRQMVGVSLIFHDISERKQAMLVQERLAALVESSNDAIVTRTVEGDITSWNAGAARMFGYTAEEAIGRRLSFLLPPSGIAMLERVNERLIAGEPVAPFRSTRLTKDGRRIEALVSVSLVRGKSGDIEGASVIFQDVSRLKQAELALTESEERFRAAFDQAAVGMALHTVGDVAPRWVRVNRTLCEILGYTEEELLASGPFDVTPEENRSESRDYMRKLIAGELPGYIRERRYRRKDGNIIWGKVSASLVRDAQGTVTHVMSVIEDITPQKIAEQALEEAQQELELAVNSASIGIWDWNPVTDEMFFSREWKALLGYDDAEIPNEKSEWERLCHPDDLSRAYAVLDECMRDPLAKYDVEVRMRHKDGSYRWVLSRASIYRDAEGRPVRVIGAHVDITERKKTEAQLARLTDFYAASSQTSEAIIRIGDRQQLFQRICEIAVENTGLLMAWIGLVEDDSGWIRPVAVAGAAADYVRGLEISIREDLLSGQGPSGRAIREGMPHLTRDFDTSISTTPWRLRAREFGIRSSAVFPLSEQGKVCGCLCLYAAEADFFDPELTQLLQ